MTSIPTTSAVVHFNSKAYDELNAYVQRLQPSLLFVLVDTNTHQYCLPKFLSHFNSGDTPIEVIEIPDGEIHKTLDICIGVWETLSDYGADRKSLLINLGGGVVTDLGGFVACTYMRGIAYINVPTSLLAMVDASVGGKTGVDLGVLKNQIGIISEAAMVLVDISFLETLPEEQLVSGFAEMLKHGLIKDKQYWQALAALSTIEPMHLHTHIHKSVSIKNAVVSQDMNEQGLRKILNFGHTLGHAIESFYLDKDTPLLHGEAIAIGMILEAFISTKVCGLPEDALKAISTTILRLFPKFEIKAQHYHAIIQLLKHDKKNSHGIVKFVLLETIGNPKLNCEVNNALIIKAFDYYVNL